MNGAQLKYGDPAQHDMYGRQRMTLWDNLFTSSLTCKSRPSRKMVVVGLHFPLTERSNRCSSRKIEPVVGLAELEFSILGLRRWLNCMCYTTHSASGPPTSSV
eukprot:947819_1